MTFEIPVPPDFSFSETVSAHGWRRLAPFDWDEDTQTLARVEALGSGQTVPLRLHMGEGQMTVESNGLTDQLGATTRILPAAQLKCIAGSRNNSGRRTQGIEPVLLRTLKRHPKFHIFGRVTGRVYLNASLGL